MQTLEPLMVETQGHTIVASATLEEEQIDLDLAYNEGIAIHGFVGDAQLTQQAARYTMIGLTLETGLVAPAPAADVMAWRSIVAKVSWQIYFQTSGMALSKVSNAFWFPQPLVIARDISFWFMGQQGDPMGVQYYYKRVKLTDAEIGTMVARRRG